MVLVDGAVPVPPAGVAQVPPHRALEEALAALAGELAVVLPAGLVPAHHAVHVGDLVPGEPLVARRGSVGRSGGSSRLLAADLQLGARVGRDVLLPLVYYHCHAIWHTLVVKTPRESNSVRRAGRRLRSVLTSGGKNELAER